MISPTDAFGGRATCNATFEKPVGVDRMIAVPGAPYWSVLETRLNPFSAFVQRLSKASCIIKQRGLRGRRVKRKGGEHDAA
jgi:hypothetical protein